MECSDRQRRLRPPAGALILPDMKSAEPVEEIPFRLEANGRPVAVWSCTPEAYEALAVGRLVSAGFLVPGDVVPALEVEAGPGSVTVRATVPEGAAERAWAEDAHIRRHGCGLLHYVDCEPALLAGDVGPLPDPDWPALFAALYGRGSERSSGVHAAALSDGERLFHRVEEVGRHNAVDKAVGGALLDGAELRGLGLVVSSRVSGEIALKAARTGLAWTATRSVPTTLALRITRIAGLPVIARAVGSDPRLYLPDRRTHVSWRREKEAG